MLPFDHREPSSSSRTRQHSRPLHRKKLPVCVHGVPEGVRGQKPRARGTFQPARTPAPGWPARKRKDGATRGHTGARARERSGPLGPACRRKARNDVDSLRRLHDLPHTRRRMRSRACARARATSTAARRAPHLALALGDVAAVLRRARVRRANCARSRISRVRQPRAHTRSARIWRRRSAEPRAAVPVHRQSSRGPPGCSGRRAPSRMGSWRTVTPVRSAVTTDHCLKDAIPSLLQARW